MTASDNPRPDPRPDAASAEDAAREPSGRSASGPQAAAGPPGDRGTNATSASVESEAAGLALVDMRDRWQRAVADLDNLRKRCQRDIEDARSGERARVAAEMLPVIDNLELALQHASADPGTIVTGVQAVRDQALSALARLGFERIEAAGARFDPNRHEAAQIVLAPDAEPGTVVAVLRPGYTAPGGLLRPAVVAVAQRPAQDAGQDSRPRGQG